MKTNTLILHSVTFFLKSRRLWDTWKNFVRPVRPRITIRHMSIACWILKAKTHTQICNIYCFSTAKTVARKHIYDTLYTRCLSFRLIIFLLKMNVVTMWRTKRGGGTCSVKKGSNITLLSLHFKINFQARSYIYIYRVSQEECARLREGIPYVKV